MALLIPSAHQCFTVVGPVVSVGILLWLMRNGDRLIAQLFPHWEWERKLGWLNAKANRRAEAILRGLRHLGHAFLLLMLVGILTLSWLAGQPHDMNTVDGIFLYAAELIYIGVCLIPWIYYFTAMLGPRISAEYEEEELMRYRAENPEEEESRAPVARDISVWDTPRSYRRM